MASVLPDGAASKIVSRGFAMRDFIQASVAILFLAAAVWLYSWGTGTSYRFNLSILTPATFLAAAARAAHRRYKREARRKK